VEIEAYTLGGKEGPRLVDEFKLTDVLVSSQQVQGGFGTTHAVSFNYREFGHTHVEQDETGGIGTKTGMTWDFGENTPGGADPLANADAIKGKQESQVGGDMDFYLKVDGIADWLHIGSYSLGVSNSGTFGSGGGGGTGKLELQDLVTTLGSSSELVQLTEFLAKGQHLKSLELEAYVSAGKGGELLVDEFKFSDVLVSSLSSGNATNNTLVFDYASVDYGHAIYSPIGKLDGFIGHMPQQDIGFF
jgi:type VI secretion system secreted protein Hcp